MFQVNELFVSLQGEGAHAGRPALFIRFQGCPIRCAFCDSKATWPKTPGVKNGPDATSARTMDLDALRSEAIAARLRYPALDHVVLTGGEPFFENPSLPTLCESLIDRGFSTIQFETSGAIEHEGMARFFESPTAARLWLTISPKTAPDKPDAYLSVSPTYLRRCRELKFVVSGPDDVTGLIDPFLEQARAFLPTEPPPQVFVQPIDRRSADVNRLATEACIEAALARNWRLSLQTHKLTGIR